MESPLKRRLLGAAILLATAFILASLLPEPKLQATGDDDVKVVTVDLNATPAAVAAVTPTPVEVIDPTVAAPDAAADADAADAYSNEGSAPEISDDAQAPDADDFGAIAAPVVTAAPTAKPAARATAAPTARPTPAVTPKATAVPTVAPTARPTLKPTPEPTAVPPTAKPMVPAAAAAPAGDRWWVQIGSFSNITNAREGETRLKALGIQVFIAPIDAPNGILYRVRGGPYSDKAQGEKALAAVLKDGFTDARLVHP